MLPSTHKRTSQTSTKSVVAVNSHPNQINHNNQWKVCTDDLFLPNTITLQLVNMKIKISVPCSCLMVLFYQMYIQEKMATFMVSTYFTYFYIYCIFLCKKLSFSIIYYANDKALSDQCSPDCAVHIVQFSTEKCWRHTSWSVYQNTELDW